MKRLVVILSLLGMVFGFLAFECASTEITSARLYMQQKKYDKALEALKKEVEKNPKSDEGYYLLGYVYGEQGNIEKMVENFDKSLQISNKFQKDIRDSRNFYWAENFNSGVGYFNKATKTTDEDSTKMFFNKAINKFQNAILAQPDSAVTYKNLTFAYLNTGERNKAVKPLETLISLNKSEDAYSILGEIFINQGQELMSQYKTSGNAQDSVAAMNKYNEAIKYLKEGRTLYPENGDILLYLSNAYISANKLDVAMEAFKAGVKQDPENKYYRYNYGVLLLESNDYKAAADQFEKAVQIDPKYTNAVYNLAATYVKWGSELRQEAEAKESKDESYKEKFKKALPYLEKYVELKPDDAQIWELLGKVYANLGMNDKSMEAFKKADQYR